jgi:GAF domain-containing protein
MAKRQQTARKATKKSKAPARRSKTAKAGANKENARLKRELSEALERQKATSGILAAINQSTFDLRAVLQALVSSAVRLCDADTGIIRRREGDTYPVAASFGFTKDEHDYFARYSVRPDRGSVFGRAILEKRSIHVPDLLADRDLNQDRLRDYAKIVKIRSGLGVPLLRDGKIIGVFTLQRRKRRPYTKKQIELVETFANQAVIAIENSRLFDEVKARTEDLSQSLEYQTATSEVLSIISRSPTDVQPVFEAIAASALRLCGAKWSVVTRYDGAQLHLAALHNLSDPKGVDAIRKIFPRPLSRGGPTDRSILTGTVINLPDVLEDPEYIYQSISNSAGYRSHLAVPMSRNGNAVGAITVAGEHTAAFTERHVNLLKAFADQAVIAIENTRLFNDTQEALERQTATSDVLRVISSSPAELQPVFDAMLENATRICAAKCGILYRCSGDALRTVATYGAPPSFVEERQRNPIVGPDPDTTLGRALSTKQPVQIADILTEIKDLDDRAAKLPKLAGARTVLAVPMVKGNTLLGAILIYRQEVCLFTDKQVELVENFAAQAAIAIENTRLLNELRESLQQQTATADVLKVISRSAFDLKAVMDTLTRSASELCNADLSGLFLRENDLLLMKGHSQIDDEGLVEFLRQAPIPVDESSYMGRAALHGSIAHIPDFENDPYKATNVYQKRLGFKALLVIPLMREGRCIGVFALTRNRVSVFSQRQIDLVQTFADQAVIAIENVRLFEEVQTKTRDLSEALTYQTGSANILRVIASSPTDINPVLQAIVESACELCDAYDALVRLKDGNHLVPSAHHGPIPTNSDKWPIERNSVSGRAVVDKKPVHVHDMQSTEGDEFPESQQRARHLGHRTILSVPLLREGESIGAIILRRTEAHPFGDKQISLLQTFADQAVIAIGNVRLFEEVQAKTRAVEEALRYQTGSANILNVIASSPTDVQPVLNAIVESACEVCEANDAAVLLKDGNDLRFRAHHGPIDIYLEKWPITRGWTAGRAFVDGKPVHLRDTLSDEGKEFLDSAALSAFPYTNSRVRSVLSVPMLRESERVGVILLRRTEMRPFSDKQIALLQTFADQAVIAIENVRLFKETQEALEQQTATSEVLEIISSSPGELEPVFQAMLANATRLCEAKYGVMWLREGGAFRSAAIHGALPAAYIEHLRSGTLVDPTPGSPLALVSQTQKAVQMPDLRESRTYLDGEPLPVSAVEVAGIRTLLLVPMFKEVDLVGAIAIYRQEVRTFTDKQIDLVTNFAKQAVIAIENTRLLKELRERTDDLTRSLDDLRAAQDRLVQTEKLASLGQLTAGIAHEIKNPLNFVNNFSALSAELTDELNDLLKDAALTDKMRQEVEELTRLLHDNLDKVVQHGKRADSIVKNMLLHSREGSGEHRPVDINAIVEDSLNLAYHGARAEKSGFTITLRQNLDPRAGAVDLYPQEVTRALLNLISNGFYAAARRKVETGDETFEPVLSASTRNLGKTVEIRIRDNGTGILPEIREKMFNPFFTTKPTGEGTGLGLSMTHDIIVKQHGGRIDVETEPGVFTEFIITLPRDNGITTLPKSE